MPPIDYSKWANIYPRRKPPSGEGLCCKHYTKDCSEGASSDSDATSHSTDEDQHHSVRLRRQHDFNSAAGPGAGKNSNSSSKGSGGAVEKMLPGGTMSSSPTNYTNTLLATDPAAAHQPKLLKKVGAAPQPSSSGSWGGLLYDKSNASTTPSASSSSSQTGKSKTNPLKCSFFDSEHTKPFPEGSYPFLTTKNVSDDVLNFFKHRLTYPQRMRLFTEFWNNSDTKREKFIRRLIDLLEQTNQRHLARNIRGGMELLEDVILDEGSMQVTYPEQWVYYFVELKDKPQRLISTAGTSTSGGASSSTSSTTPVLLPTQKSLDEQRVQIFEKFFRALPIEEQSWVVGGLSGYGTNPLQAR
ncbi:unnamed protein product [Amoebophrya sp. A120]|nr:unnamed protein product [Amoebophrya sp. A120]|eukprot:GSA120T00014288001.1